eukprot:1054973-Rhodomonas_salina.1
MTSVLDDNVHCIAVQGTFDDCQAPAYACAMLCPVPHYACAAVPSNAWAMPCPLAHDTTRQTTPLLCTDRCGYGARRIRPVSGAEIGHEPTSVRCEFR